MSSLGTSKGIMEIAKFGVYVTVPICLMYFFATNTKNLHQVMGKLEKHMFFSQEFLSWIKEIKGLASKLTECFYTISIKQQGISYWLLIYSIYTQRSYVVYPPEGPRPQSPEELREMAREIARQRNSR